MTTIAILGASGQYGRSLTDKLIQQGRASDLILITRTPAKLTARAQQGCVIRYGDFDKPESMHAALVGADRVMLISGTRVGARVVQHKVAIEAAVAAQARQIVYTSFLNPVPENPAIVTLDHSETENLIRASGIAWTFLRDAHYADAMILNAGPGFIAAGTWFTSTAGGREAMVWREDCVNCALAVLTQDGHEHKAYDITGPNLENFEEVAAMMSEVSGHPVKVVQTTDEGMYAHFDALGIPRHPVDDQTVAGIPWNSDDMVSFERSIREGYLNIRSDDVQKLTGQRARSVRELIEANAAFLKGVKPAG